MYICPFYIGCHGLESERLLLGSGPWGGNEGTTRLGSSKLRKNIEAHDDSERLS
jgi:hypothetical protein